MRRNGKYRRVDGVEVTVYYCPRCRRVKADRPTRIRRRRGEGIFLDDVLGSMAEIDRCPFCGGELVKNGSAKLGDGFKIRTYLCKACNRSIRFTSVVRKLQSQL